MIWLVGRLVGDEASAPLRTRGEGYEPGLAGDGVRGRGLFVLTMLPAVERTA